jgi:hypothetical protein
MTREQRRDAAKARKQAAIAKKNQKVPEAGDLPTDSEDEESDDDMPANPNHTAKARSQAAKAPAATEEPAAAPAAAKGKGKAQDVSQLSRREREAFQAQQAKERYEKMHAEGKTEQARADLERLALVKERREAEASRKKAEAEERAELEKEKAELMEREKRRREQALGKKERLAKGDKTSKEYYGISCLSTIPFSHPFHRLPRTSKSSTSSIQRESLPPPILPTPFLPKSNSLATYSSTISRHPIPTTPACLSA